MLDFMHVDQTNIIDEAIARPKGMVIEGTKTRNDPNNKVNNVIDDKYTSHVQSAYNLGIPAIVNYQWYPDIYQEYALGFPMPKDAWDVKVISWLLTGHANAGMILDMSNYTFANGNKLTASNYAKGFEYLYRAIRGLFPSTKLYVRIASKKDNRGNVLDPNSTIYGADTQGAIETLINNNLSGDPATHTYCGMACDYRVAPSGGLTWDNPPVPPATYKPIYDANVTRVLMSFYYYGASMPGITGKVGFWQYAGDYARFCQENGYTPSTVTPTPTPTPNPTPITGDLSTVITQLNRMEVTLNQIRSKFS